MIVFLLALTILIISGGVTTASQNYHIVPVNSTHLCQHYQTGSCLTLDQLFFQLSETGDITLSFLPGDHLLTWDMMIRNVNKVTLNREQFNNYSNCLPRITCSEGMGIVVEDVELFSLKELEIHGCRRAGSGGAILLYRTSAVIENTIFENNTVTVGDFGGGALYIKSTNNTNKSIFIRACIFFFNGAIIPDTLLSYGGAIVVEHIGMITISNTSFISNIASETGGAINAYDANLYVYNCSFINNTAGNGGGGIYTYGGPLGSLVSSYNVYLQNNAYHTGGAVINVNLITSFKNDKFLSNQAQNGSAVLSLSNATTTFTDCVVTGNLGGSVLHITLASAKFTGHNFVVDNSGSLQGDQSQLLISGYTLFINNIGESGGAITGIGSTITLDLFSQTLINKNKANKGGGVHVKQSTLNLFGSLKLTENIAGIAGGGIYATQSTIHAGEYSHYSKQLEISYNVAKEDGGGVYLSESNLNISNRNVTVNGNTARHYGGGMFLSPSSQIILNSFYSQMYLILQSNLASNGGGLYLEDNEGLCPGGKETNCFLHNVFIYDFRLRLLFWKNNATQAGKDIYGGLLDRCTIPPRYYYAVYQNYYNGLQYIQEFSAFDWALNKSQRLLFRNLSSRDAEKVTNISDFRNHISSDPVRVCFCEKDIIDCNSTHPTVFKKKGEKFTLSLVATDQVGMPVNATIISMLSIENGDTGRLEQGQRHREISNQCTSLEYRIYSGYDSVAMELYAEGPCRDRGLSKQEVKITFQPCTCPVGFERIPPDTNCSCNCDNTLSNYISKCSTEDGTIQIDSNVWIEHVNSTNTTGYIIHHCPFDYCVQKPVILSLADQDKQCAFDRTGTLCGECKEGLSLVFATSNCQQCSNDYLFLILPFALAGIALVAFILMLNMTVATGTIHGLIFYSNILVANRSIFIPSDSPALLSVFISWLNLDLGIETCFYSGMNSFGKVLLQLVFPAYVFVLIAIIMLVCDRSQRIAGLLGKMNPEATLYTLLLFSYSKLIRLIITALQFATISYPDNTHEIVWLYDANVVYFTASHIPRFIAAIMITILGAAYTSLLLFGQLFNRCSEYRLMKWTTHKYYIHFLKAHHAPFSDKHRYWVGLLLLVRLAHYLISAFVSDSTDILSASFVAFFLILYKLLNNGRIYRNYWLDSLETLFLVNLFIIGAVTFINKYFYTDGNQTALAIVSMSISFIAFLVMVLYHILHSCGVKLGTVCRQALCSLRHHRHYQLIPNNDKDEEEDLDDEPLIELDSVENDTDNIVTDPDRYITPPIIRLAVGDDQLREPLLDDHSNHTQGLFGSTFVIK